MKIIHAGALLLAAGVAAVSAADTYPATYPFDTEYGEGLPDVTFPDGTPSYTYGMTDKGGYEKLRYSCDFAKEMKKGVYYDKKGVEVPKGLAALGLNVSKESQWSPWYCPGSQYSAKNYLLDKTEDLSTVKTQCTVAKNMKVQWDTRWATNIAAGTKKSFSADIGQKINPDGTVGTPPDCTDCCKKFSQGDSVKQGVRVWIPPFSGIATVKTFMQSDSCTISLGEAGKCFIMESYNPVCVNNYISATKRHYVYPCPDILLRHYFSCKLRMAAPILADAPEPASYAKRCSAKQGASQMAMNRTPDKICQPYSYYYPALKKPAGSTDYYSPNSPLGKNDPSGKPASSPSSPGATPTAPKSSANIARFGTMLFGLIVLFT